MSSCTTHSLQLLSSVVWLTSYHELSLWSL